MGCTRETSHLHTFEERFTMSSGQPSEIDVRKLGLQERKDLVERLVRDAEVDNEKFLFKLKERIDK